MSPRIITLTESQIILLAKQSHPANGTGRLVAAGKVMIQVHCRLVGGTMTVTAQPGVSHRAGYLTAGAPIVLATNVPVSDANTRDTQAKRLCSSMFRTTVPIQWIKS